MVDADRRLLRRLAEFSSRDGRAVSVVLDLDPSTTGTAGALATRVNSLADEAERRTRAESGTVGHEAARALRGDVDRIRSYLERDLDRSGVRALAFYADEAEGVFTDVRLTKPWPDELRIGTRFALAPLLPTVERDRELLVAVVDRKRGTLMRVRHWRVEHIDDLTEDTHGRHDQGGWSQARYERSVEREAEDHIRRVAGEIGRRVEAGSDTLVGIACPEEQRRVVLDALPPPARDAFAGWIATESHVDAERLVDDAAFASGAAARRRRRRT